MLLTDKQANRQTNPDKNITSAKLCSAEIITFKSDMLIMILTFDAKRKEK